MLIENINLLPKPKPTIDIAATQAGSLLSWNREKSYNSHNIRKGRKEMDLITGIKERRSIRKFQDKKVPRELIEEIVNISAYAPSWKNTQVARYIIVDDKDKIKAMANEKCTYGFTGNIPAIENAAAVLLLTYVEGRSGYERDGSYSTEKEDRWQMFDAGTAAQTFCLVAHEKGLGTVIQGYFDEEEIKKIVEIPEGQVLAALIPLGYPDIDPAAPPRKDASKLLTFV